MAFADGYIEVADRIQEFKALYPDGTLQSFMPPYVVEAAGKVFVVYSAAAYRTPDDPRPGIGWAWEPVPGPTPYTRDSEMMNAETSAWGRAIVALGFATKKIASAEEVRNRQAYDPPRQDAPRSAPPRDTRNDAPRTEGDATGDPGDAVFGFGAHKGLTIRQVYDMPKDADGKNDGFGYLQWVAFKMEPKAASGTAVQEATQRFLQAQKNAYDKSVLDPTGDPGPVSDESDGIPF